MTFTTSTPTTPTPDMPSPTKVAKQRHTKSCKRCTRRKQRCHGFPVCRACDEARVPCEPSAYAVQLHAREGPDQNGNASLHRIQTLETQLAGALAELTVLRQQQQPFLLDRPLLFDTDDSTLVNGQCGPGSVEQMVQSTVWSKGLFSVGDGVPLSPMSSMSPMPAAPVAPMAAFSVPPLQPLPPAHLAVPSVSPRPPSPPPQPTDAMGRRMIEAYFTKIHPRYPFLHRAELTALHEHAQKQAGPPPVSSSPSLAHRFGVFRLNMVYAIGGTLLKITDPLCEAQAETYLAVALRDVAVVQDAQAGHTTHFRQGPGTTLLTIEGLVLLVLYNLRAPTNTGIWYLTNLAMQTCIDLRLHLEVTYHDASLSAGETRTMRRLFWSAYVLDRFIALSFKRPFSIAESDIETAIPDGTTDGPKGPMWRHFIEIKRLESRIQTDVYGVGESLQKRRQKVPLLLGEVDAWGRSVSSASALTPHEVVYLQLQWHSAVAQLLRPFLSSMHRDDPLLKRCLHAAGLVCAIFREMHMHQAYGHSFVSAHTTFLTGVTMCYCLFRAATPPSGLARLLDARVAAHLRACSATMFLIAERYHRLRKHRDILEDIIGRIMEARMRDVPPNTSMAGPAIGPTTHTRDQFSQHDFVAVQSLLNLAAQQEPETVPETETDTVTRAVAEVLGDTSTVNTLLAPNQPNLHPALDFTATGSWDVDRYSLEMLGRMFASE